MPEKQLWRTTDVTETSDSDLEGVGSLRWVGSNLYRWVKNANASDAFTQGQVCCHDLSDADGINFKEVITPATADLSALAGVVMAPSLGAGKYGWIQVLGYCETVSCIGETTGGNNVAVGDYMKPVNTKTYVTRDTATQPAYRRNIQCLEAITTSQTPTAANKKAWINCI